MNGRERERGGREEIMVIMLAKEFIAPDILIHSRAEGERSNLRVYNSLHSLCSLSLSRKLAKFIIGRKAPNRLALRL
jgi:hypothetical protein